MLPGRRPRTGDHNPQGSSGALSYSIRKPPMLGRRTVALSTSMACSHELSVWTWAFISRGRRRGADVLRLSICDDAGDPYCDRFPAADAEARGPALIQRL